MESVFTKLKTILKVYEDKLLIVHDKSDNYYLHTNATDKKKKGEFFGAVQIKKNYVAYHLMPVYYAPELLDKVSDDLKKQMQGKSCFNFKAEDATLFRELKALTAKCFKDYKSKSKI